MFTNDDPFYGSLSATFVIDDYTYNFEDVVNRLKSVVCVATLDGAGKLKFHIVTSEHRELETLKYDRMLCTSLPLFIFSVLDEPPIDAPPKSVG